MTSTADTMAIRRSQAGRWAIAVIFFVNGLGFSSFVPHIPLLKARFDLSPATLGLALLGPAIGAILTMPIAGMLAGRYGSRIVTLLAGVAMCVVLPFLLYSPSYWAVAGLLVLLGVFNGGMDVGMNANGVLVESRLRRPVMSSLHAMFSIGAMVGAGGAVLALSLGISAEVHLTAACAVGLIAILAVAPWVLAEILGQSKGKFFTLPKGPVLILGGMAFFILMAEGAMADWSAVYLNTIQGSSLSFAGAGYAVFSAAMAAGRLAGDRLVGKFGPVSIVAIGGGLAALGLGLVLIAPSPAWALIGFAAVGLGASNIVPVLFSAAGRMPGHRPGTAIAAMTTAGYSGFLAGPPLIGFIAEAVGLPVSFGLLALALALVALGAPFLRLTQKG